MSDLCAGERIGGRYLLEQRLGLGGMGEVWLAQQEGAGAFRRRVVLKVLAPERRGDARLAAMLADEARLVGLLHHPGLVSALDYLETPDHGPVFVLEYVDGCSLRTALRLARKNNVLMPESLAVHVGVHVAHALHAAHTAVGIDGRPLSVIHRDISPDNVLLSRSGGVYLGDFGVARAATNSALTLPGDGPKGKRGYMPPEQAAGERLTPAADVFALARVVAEAADVRCGRALRKVLEKATAEKPRDRYESAAAFAAALAHCCNRGAEPQTELARWLHTAAAEALEQRRTSPGTVPPPSEPPPAGRPVSTPTRVVSLSEPPPLFAAVPPPRRTGLKIAAAAGALLMLLPVALIFGLRFRGTRHAISAFAADLAPDHGDLRVRSRPDQAEVYVDGQLRGVTPLLVELEPGMHAVRVGSPRLEKWRAAQVQVKSNTEHRLDIDLTQ